MIIDKDNVIVAGHTRYKAAIELGMKEVPCIVADDLSPKQIKAFRLADNKTSDFSIWDNVLLLKELEDIGFDIYTGFEQSDLFEDIKSLEILDENDNKILDENKNGVVYTIQFKTQNKKLIDKIKDIIDENKDSIYE